MFEDNFNANQGGAQGSDDGQTGAVSFSNGGDEYASAPTFTTEENPTSEVNLTEEVEKDQAEVASDMEMKTQTGEVTLDALLDFVIDNGASDLHFAGAEKVGVRIDGKIHFLDNVDPLTSEQVEKFICQGLMANDEKLIQKYKDSHDVDFAHTHKDGTPFRVNVFYKRGEMAAVLRRINRSAFTFEDLGLPEGVDKFCRAKSGLVLVCGPTGSGKSSTLAAMIEWINTHRSEHILTIEDPIEYLFESKNSVISQREIGRDTDSFAVALRALLREDPDVAMIGELRDPETIMTAIELCETGHLVFGTFHTGSAAQTLNRLVANFPPSSQSAVSVRLADALVGVMCQRLVPKVGGGRTGIFELVMANGAIRNLIRNNDTAQIDSVIQTSGDSGMISMRRYAQQKENQGLIKREDYINYFEE